MCTVYDAELWVKFVQNDLEAAHISDVLCSIRPPSWYASTASVNHLKAIVCIAVA